MTRPVRDRILKDANGDISDHLRNHIHLTNCIHLKNHMHKQSPILADRTLRRDLVVLQRSRSLKDPSMSPPSWGAPSANNILPRRSERDARVSCSRRSLGMEKQNDSNSPVLASSTSKVGPTDRIQERRRNKTEESVGKNFDLGGDELDGDDMASSSHFPFRRRQAQNNKVEHGIRSSCSGLNKARKRRKFQGSRNRRNAKVKKEAEADNAVSVASNSFSRNENENEMNITQHQRNGCGIPWNWSRIHHRGKLFLDSAGKSFSCGLSDPNSKRKGSIPQERDFSDMPMVSDHSSSSYKSNVEVSPLLVDANTAAWEHDYSGELGVFADNLLKGGSEYNHRSGSRHQNITQKYNPRSFRDLVGQNLVVQALTNAVSKRKISFLYAFYGPHGTGKTSCARIFARALVCRSLEHPKPCGHCESCIAHETGKNHNVQEVGPLSNFDFDRIMDFLEIPSLQYKVFIFDDCDSLSPSSWNSISKVVDRAPKRVVFLLISSSLDVLPHIIISRCQRFFFPKLKDSDIIYALQLIGSKEGLEIEKDALKLIASRSDGSLRDAEMMLDQLTLLGQRITVPLVQELVGLISDEKLVDLLDLALSADTVNTVRNLREIMATGVEPLALMSQLATVITDILAGSYNYMKERPGRRFFRRQSLSKEDMEKLRQALKTLSEAEKQLRMSNDRLTWLTAALLQLAPDQQYLLPSPSAGPSLNKSNLDNTDVSNTDRGFQSKSKVEASSSSDRKRMGNEIEEIWLEVLDNIRVNTVKEFMRQEGKLMSVTFGADPTVQLMFVSHLAKSRAEKFKKHILQGFESVLGSPLTIEIKYGSKKYERGKRFNNPLVLPVSQDSSSRIYPNPTFLHKDKDYLAQSMPSHVDSTRNGVSEIVEIEASSIEPKGNKERINNKSSHKRSNLDSQRKLVKENPCKSIVKSKVTLAHVIQQAEGWSKRRGFSIAEKLEQENLRLEPRSRSLLCWKASRVTGRKVSRLKIRARKTHTLLKYVSCGKCLSARSPR